MPRYKLRVPAPGTWLYGDGARAVVADTEDEARALFMDEYEEPWPALVHSYIGLSRVVYARDIEGGDCHEDAEPGDTTLDYLNDNGRGLREGEVRVWMLGAPRPFVATSGSLPAMPTTPAP